MDLIKNVAYGERVERDHLLDIYLPENKDFKTFVYIHGGGIVEGNKEGVKIPDCEAITKAGYAVVKINYRLYPNAKFPEYLYDAAQAVAWVKEHIKDYGGNGDLIVGGSSAGGYISMMICFDDTYLKAFGVSTKDITAWIFDAGQPTSHFNHLKFDKKIDSRAIVADESAPIYFVRQYDGLAPMLIFAAENDMACRLEQTHMLLKTLKMFGYPEENIKFEYMEGYRHCEYNNYPCFAEKILSFLKEHNV